MEIFNTCFKDLVFTRVNEKQGYVIYGAGIATGLAGGHKQYVLLFVPSYLAFKPQARIHELSWQNLQTRNLVNSYRLKGQSWVLPRDISNILLKVQSRSKKYSTYSADKFPFEILLLHDPKKKTIYQYHNKIMLEATISTFSAVFNYIGKTPSLLHTSGPTVASPPVNIPLQSSGTFGHINVPSIKNWFRAGGDTEYISRVDDIQADLDDSFELLYTGQSRTEDYNLNL